MTPNRVAPQASNRLPQNQPPKDSRVQHQSYLKETLLSLTQLMEGLAQDADANQKKILRGGFTLNSEKRAQLKAMQNTDKSFKNLISSLEYQFEELKAMAMPPEKEG